MEPEMYKIIVDGCEVARNVSLEYVGVFVKSIFMEFYNDKGMTIAIQREQKNERMV